MPELTPQDQAKQICFLAAWCQKENEFLQMLLEAGCTPSEAAFCMTSEAV